MKKVFSIIAISTVAILIAAACKKSSNTTSNPAQTTNYTPVAPYGGQMQLNNTFTDETNTSGGIKDSTGSAATLLTGAVNVGTVTVNNTQLTYQYTTYFIPTHVIPMQQGKATWSVSGGNGFGAFSYTTTKSMPVFSDLHLNLTTITRANGLVIAHPAITADSIGYNIMDNNGHLIQKVVGNTSTGFTFTAAMLSSLTSTVNSATVQVVAQNMEYSTQGGKNISFLNSTAYVKTGITIN